MAGKKDISEKVDPDLTDVVAAFTERASGGFAIGPGSAFDPDGQGHLIVKTRLTPWEDSLLWIAAPIVHSLGDSGGATRVRFWALVTEGDQERGLLMHEGWLQSGLAISSHAPLTGLVNHFGKYSTVLKAGTTYQIQLLGKCESLDGRGSGARVYYQTTTVSWHYLPIANPSPRDYLIDVGPWG